MFRIRVLPALSMLLLCFGLIGQPQAQVFPRGNGISLTGIKNFDAYVDVSHWVEMTQDRTQFRVNAQAVFEGKLAEAGVLLRPAVREYLICKVQATGAGRTVAYTVTLQFWEIDSIDLNRLLWERGGIATIPQDEFNEERVASECAQFFVEEWRTHNPA